MSYRKKYFRVRTNEAKELQHKVSVFREFQQEDSHPFKNKNTTT